jgi:hypothetical protein
MENIKIGDVLIFTNPDADLFSMLSGLKVGDKIIAKGCYFRGNDKFILFGTKDSKANCTLNLLCFSKQEAGFDPERILNRVLKLD